MLKKELLGAMILSALTMIFIIINTYFPALAKVIDFIVFWACALFLLYHIIFIICAKIKSRKK